MDPIYKYAVIRAIPDPRKGEIINIGIVVLHPQTVDTHIAPSLHKLLALDGAVDIEAVRQLPQAISEWTSRFETVEDKYQAICNFGLMTLSELGSFRTARNLSYADQVANLMRTLVHPRPRELMPPVANRITTLLRDIFKRHEVLGKFEEDIDKHLVVPNFPISPDENLFSDFALKNGSYWFTETADFRAKSNRQLDNTRVASLAAIKLVTAKKRFHSNKVKTLVVYAGDESDTVPQLNLLSEYTPALFNISNKHDMAHYTDLIMGAAGPNRQIGSA